MGCRQLPGGYCTEVAQCILHVKVKCLGINWYMPQGHVLLRSFVRSQWIEPDLKGKPRRLCLVKGDVILIHSHMTGRTVILRLGMADMTTCLVLMDPVGYHVFRLLVIDFLVTSHAFRSIFHLIPVSIVLSIAVHLLTGMAFIAFHVFFSMNTRQGPLLLTKILFVNTAPVTGRTNLFHRGLSLIQMTVPEDSETALLPLV